MKRMTLNSYKRKIIVFGILVFMSIGLISTGFAAWVMSTNPSENATGNVNVGLIENGNLTLTLTDKQETYNIAFEAAADDTEGRIRAAKDSAVESLSFEINGEVSPLTYLGSLTYSFVVPAGVQRAIEEDYIVLVGMEDVDPVANQDATQYTYTVDITQAAKDAEGVFKISIEFAWGEKFGKMNPGHYYDDHETGKAVSDNDCVRAIEDFRAIVCGYYDALVEAEAAVNGAAEKLAARQRIINDNLETIPAFALNIYAASNAE